MRKPNNLLEKDVNDELSWDPWLDDTQINVKADDGRVTLTGAVPTYADLVEATDKTWGVSGVTSVDNELLVGPAARPWSTRISRLGARTPSTPTASSPKAR